MMGGAEPTVTINTKEALADVFGMFNSPEKTAKLAAISGTANIPMKKLEPATPIAPPSLRKQAHENENANAKTPIPGWFIVQFIPDILTYFG
jgi:checkpoint serine/threonine-protein kinase